jgi:hypothetical protein
VKLDGTDWDTVCTVRQLSSVENDQALAVSS